MTRAAGRPDRRRLRLRSGRCIRRIEIRRLGRELRGARVDHRVAGPQAERQPARRAAPPRRRRPSSRARGRRSRPASRSRGASPPRRPRDRPAGRRIARTSRLQRDVPAHLGEEPRRDPGRLLDRRLRDAAAEQAEEPPQPRVRRREEPAEDDRGGRPLGVAGRLAGVAASRRPSGSARRSAPSVAAVDARKVVEASASSSGPRRAVRRRPARARGGPCSAPSRTSGRSPSPRRSPSSGCRASGRRVGNLSNGKRGSLTTT